MKRLFAVAFVLAIVGAAVASIDGSSDAQDEIDMILGDMPLTNIVAAAREVH